MVAGGGIPDAYDGREQARIKHKLLESYLQKLFLIVGMSAGRGGSIELCYVDCFAGPWGDDFENMNATSIAISLRTLDRCRQQLGIKGIDAKIRALYVEEGARAFVRLSVYLKSSTPEGIHADCRKGDFVALRDEILKWAGRNAFVFFFIDPKGWKEIGIETLRRLLQRPRSEFLINFMYNHINRTMSMADWQPAMVDLLGESINLDGMGPERREQVILKTYRENLKRCMPAAKRAYPPRAAHVRVLDPSKERPKYHLVYVTSHAQGIVKFMEISQNVDLVQKEVRALKKGAQRERRSGVVDMFGAESLVDPNAGHASPEDVDRFWLSHLGCGTCRIRRDEFADILESTDWFPGDLQASLARLINQGLIRNLDASGPRPKKPLHFEIKGGERLQLMENQG